MTLYFNTFYHKAIHSRVTVILRVTDPKRVLKYSKPISVRSNLGIIKESKTFFLKNGNFHGILGLAYPILSQPSSLNPKSTLFDDFVKRYRIPNMFSVVLCGYNKVIYYEYVLLCNILEVLSCKFAISITMQSVTKFLFKSILHFQ